MRVGAFAAHLAGFNPLLSVVPSAAGIRHHDGQQEARRGGANQHTSQRFFAQHKADHNRHNHSQRAGQNHFAQGAFGANANASTVVRLGRAFHQTGDFAELAAHL